MSNLQNRVEIIVNANASQANKVLDDITKKTKKTSDDTWKKYAQSQEKWLKVAEDGLRRYGGKVGGVIANMINGFDKVKKAMDATKGVSAVAGGAKAAGAAGVGGVGASGALLAAANPVTIAAAAVGAAAIGVGALALADSEKVENLIKSVAQFERLKTLLEGIRDPAERLRIITSELGENGTDKFEKLREEAEKFGQSTSGIGRQWMEFSHRIGKSTDALKAGFKTLWSEFMFQAKESIATPINMLAYLDTKLQKFLGTSIGKSPTVNESVDMAKSNLAGEAADKKRKEMDDAKKVSAKQEEVAKKELRDLEIEKRSTEDRIKSLTIVLSELQKKAAETGRNVDKLNLAKAEKELAELKGKQKTSDDKAKEDAKRKGDEEIKDILDKNPNLYDPTKLSGKDILQSESDRLRDSALSPSEIALRNAGVSLIDGSIMSPEARAKTLGNKKTKDLLTRAQDIGKLGSHKRVLDSAAKYEQNKKNMEKAATLETLAQSYIDNGKAWMVKPVNGK